MWNVLRFLFLQNSNAGASEDEKHSDVYVSPAEQELSRLKLDMQSALPVGALLQVCLTLDQAKAVLTFADAIAEKTLRATCSLTAGRGYVPTAALRSACLISDCTCFICLDIP